jgi:hypothetical protein
MPEKRTPETALARWQRRLHPCRDLIITWIFWTGASLAFASIVAAILLRVLWPCHLEPWGHIIVGGWVAIPPLYFLAEYIVLPPDPGPQDERVRHMHDLGRNIWLALVVLLSAIFGIKDLLGA